MIDFPETGKIDNEFFKSMIFPNCGYNRREVVTPPQYGVDVSVIDLPNGFQMALTSDPLTLIPSMGLRESAWLSVHLMANDMATTGKAPMYAQFVLNLPDAFPVKQFNEYWNYIHSFCQQIGTAITGGHTGRFEGQNSTVAGGGTMITIAPQGEMITSKGANPGDVIMITKESALIAASILALSFPATVKDKCGVEVQRKAVALFDETSALEAALTAATLNTPEDKIVTAMHDVTEGGILGAIYEMALASGCGAEVDEEALPTGEVQKEVCKLFDINPHYSVGAGSMIIAVKKDEAELLIEILNKRGIKASEVGKFVSKEDGMIIKTSKGRKPLVHPGTDPYWKAFYTAFAQGLK